MATPALPQSFLRKVHLSPILIRGPASFRCKAGPGVYAVRENPRRFGVWGSFLALARPWILPHTSPHGYLGLPSLRQGTAEVAVGRSVAYGAHASGRDSGLSRRGTRSTARAESVRPTSVGPSRVAARSEDGPDRHHSRHSTANPGGVRRHRRCRVGAREWDLARKVLKPIKRRGPKPGDLVRVVHVHGPTLVGRAWLADVRVVRKKSS